MTILFESAIRVTLIAAVIALVLFAMRIKTASVLHAVWASFVVLMMLLPAWVAWGPKASLPVLPPQATAAIEPVTQVPPPLPAGLEERSPSPVREDGGFSLLGVYLAGLAILPITTGDRDSACEPADKCFVRCSGHRGITPPESHSAGKLARMAASATRRRTRARE